MNQLNNHWLARAVASLALAGTLASAPTVALANVSSVSGIDYWYYTSAEQDSAATLRVGSALDEPDTGVDVLAITGDAGDVVYVDVFDNGRMIASHLSYTLADGAADSNGQLVGVLSINVDGFNPTHEYTIKVYDRYDQASANLLYDGTLSVVYGLLGEGEGAQLRPLAFRTVSIGEDRPFNLPQAISAGEGNMVYTLASDKPIEDPVGQGRTIYQYQASVDAPQQIDGRIRYFDLAQGTQGEPLRTDAIPALAMGESRQVSVPELIRVGDSYYRTIQVSNALTASYPGVSDFVVMCQVLKGEWGKVGAPYTARIGYVDDNGGPLVPQGMVDTVAVNRYFRYTPPSTIYVTEADSQGEPTVVAYALAANADILTDGVLLLAPGDAGDVDEQGSVPAKDYAISYQRVDPSVQRTWTVKLVCGQTSADTRSRTLQTHVCTWKQGDTYSWDGEEPVSLEGDDAVTYRPPQTITVGEGEDALTYQIVSTMDREYTHKFGAGSAGAEQVIYYVPEGYVAPDPYDFVVTYRNIANNQIIRSESHTANPTSRADLDILVPQNLTENGVEWVMVNGQLTGTVDQDGVLYRHLYHSFYAPTRSYTVYYRDVNDARNANTVITTVSTVYDGTTTTVAAADRTAIATGTLDAGTAGTAATAILDSASGIRAVSGTDVARLITNDGTDVDTVRIEDDANPLAAPDSAEDEGAQAVTGDAGSTEGAAVNGGLMAIAIIAAIALAALLFLALLKRRKGDDKTE